MDLTRMRQWSLSAILLSAAVVTLLIEPQLSSATENVAFQVRSKFAGKRKKDLGALKAHDSHRHSRLLSAIDLPLGGDSQPESTGLYFTKIGLGTPSRDYHVQVDTGSDILWVNCAGCIRCPRKSDLVELTQYDSDASSSAKSVSCDDSFCSYINQISECHSGSTCQYIIQYGDQSSTSGYLVRDVMHLDLVTGNRQTGSTNGTIIFGCGSKQSGQLGESASAVDGIMGFGQSNSSFISQLASQGKVKRSFAHCLDNKNGGGIFAIGEVVSPKVKTTPMLSKSAHYSVNLNSIEVGNSVLQLSSGAFDSGDDKGVIVDSGTTLVYLPNSVYKALISEILASHPELTLHKVQASFTCFRYFDNLDRFPPVTFQFDKSASLTVSPREYLFQIQASFTCFRYFDNLDRFPTLFLQPKSQTCSLRPDQSLNTKTFTPHQVRQRKVQAKMDYNPNLPLGGGGGSMRRSISRSVSRASRNLEDIFSSGSRRTQSVNDDEEALKWAAIEKLPTYSRLRTTLMTSVIEDDVYGNQLLSKEVDVTKLDGEDRQKFIDMVFKVAEQDNERILTKLRNRIDRVGIKLPTVEVRYEHLTIKADCYTGSRSLPTLLNVVRNMAESALGLIGIQFAKKAQLTILKDISGSVKPGRMTLLLGPPSSGKTTLLLALAGKLDKALEVTGDITYNGYRLDEFVPRKTSAYISQNDLHVGIMTVKETLDFSARCQGVGTRYDLLNELARREKDAGIFPEADVDLFMKASAAQGVKSSLVTDYTLKILGLDICKDTIVGDDMMRGISGGQKKRVTTGEMIVGPTKTLFMDEISTGLDSSTTFQIVKCLQQIVHLTDATVLMSLLQPAPETFDLFDDIILLSEGQIVYQGPRDHILEFFESFGFKCPERKGTADFLQEVTSKKDQEQYWVDRNRPYRYIPVSEFASRFKSFHVGQKLSNELSVPFDKSRGHKAALVFDKYSVSKMELLKSCWDKEWLLMQRNAFFYVFKTVQIIIIAAITSTLFLRTEMHTNNESDANLYVGALLFGMIINMFNGFAEMAMMVSRLPVFYKQRDLLFYPSWTFTLPTFLLGIPTSIFESTAWMVVTYYSIGFAPDAGRFFKQFLLVFLIQQMAAALFRLIASVCRTMMIANTGGALTLLLVFLLGGFLLPRSEIPEWWRWAYWISPLTYAFNGLTVNEMFAPRWMNKLAFDNRTRLGTMVLRNWDVYHNRNWYWIGVGALLGFTVLFNLLFTFALTYLNPLGKKSGLLPEEENEDSDHRGGEVAMGRMGRNADSAGEASSGGAAKRGMVLPFSPLAMSFDDVRYFVDMPAEMREQGVTENRLQLLKGVTGAFRPGVLTALMGVSGAGKTTLMDVLAGRKTGGYIEGDVRISGFPKVQETFARISGYCEQTDIHSPQVTVRESLIFSAFLRLPKEVGKEEKMMFVDQVMELVELDSLKDSIVGLPGVTGLSTEQRKRLTIAVELVANPSIIFMDEPTSGLDARAAAIVMRAVRNTVDTGRTVVCTIHQPSIDIFEAFDELMLMKRGGQVIYAGPLGRNSHKVVEYFESFPGVPKIPEKYNPATWMLEASSLAAELKLGVDFAELYKSSALHQRNKALVKELSVPPAGASDLYFATQFSQNTWGQFKSCLWKQWWTYWRSPDYNLVRFIFTLATSLLIGTIFWQIGGNRSNAADLTMVIGALYAAVIFVGINNCSTVQPMVAVERTVFYRERAAGMYSAMPYAISQVTCELPYVLIQTTYYSLIVYAMVGFEWTAAKFFWFLFVSYFSFLYWTYYGMMTVSLTPNQQVASIFASAFYGIFNLFSGFFIPRPKIPKWWIWYYWICPVAWTVYGLIVSQYGDVETPITVLGGPTGLTVKQYIKDNYGFESDFMGPVAAVLVAFTVFFAFIFAFCIRTLNFQTR